MAQNPGKLDPKQPSNSTHEAGDQVYRVQQVDSAGEILSGASPASAEPGDPLPTEGLLIGGKDPDSSTFRAAEVDSGGNLSVSLQEGSVGFLADHPVDNTGATVTIKTADVNATTDGDNSIISAVASKKIWILSIFGTATAAGLVTFKDGATVKKRIRFAAAGDGFVYDGGLQAPFMIGSTNTAFQINTTASQDFEGGVTYIELP